MQYQYNKWHCCLLRRFNHNYYASNHHIAEDHFPIFVRRVIQMAKVIARRPKLFMNEMSPFKKVHHKMCAQVWNRTRYSWLIIKRLNHWAVRATLTMPKTFTSILSLISVLLPINSNLILVYHRISTI